MIFFPFGKCVTARPRVAWSERRPLSLPLTRRHQSSVLGEGVYGTSRAVRFESYRVYSRVRSWNLAAIEKRAASVVLMGSAGDRLPDELAEPAWLRERRAIN